MPSLLKMMAEIGLNISPFQRGLKTVKKETENLASLGNTIQGAVAGYFGFRALKAAFYDVAKGMAQIQDRADQFNITTDDVQKLSIAAQNVGLDFEDVGSALMKLGAARAAALGGDESKISAFNKFGAGGLLDGAESNLDVMKRIAATMQGMKIDSSTQQAMREIFGKGGSRMIAALKEMNSGDPEALISAEQIANVDKAEEALKRLKRQIDVTLAPKISTGVDIAQNTIFSKAFWRDVKAGIWGGKFAPGANPFDETDGSPLAQTRLTKSQIEKEIKDKAAHLKAHPEDAGIIDSLFHTNIELGTEKPKPFDNPKTIANARKVEFEIQQKQEEIVFAHASHLGKIEILQGKIKDSGEAELRLKQQLLDATISQSEYEQHIAEQKRDQQQFEEQIYQLKQRYENVSLDQFRRLGPGAFQAEDTRRHGSGGATEYGKTMIEYVEQLKKIERNTGRNIIFLGGR